MAKISPSLPNSPSVGVGLSTHRHLTAVGLSDRERLQRLMQVPDQIPPRRIETDAVADPFGLLEQDDTYERLAGLIFQECEGIYRQVVVSNPDIAKQSDKAYRKPKKASSIHLPSMTLMDHYTYEMVREADSTSTQFLFHRTDPGYEDKGFRIVQQGDGHVVLKSADPEGTDISDDNSYYLLLHKAQQWIQDYANSLNIEPGKLLKLARLNIEPPTLGQRAVHVGEMTAGLAILAGEMLFTKQKEEKYGRRTRPRILGILAAVALVPIPGHGIAGEVAVHGGETAAKVAWAGTSAVGIETGRLAKGTYDVVSGYLDAVYDAYADDGYDQPDDHHKR